jgi:ABC-2 type transport system ATP-binding protein
MSSAGSQAGIMSGPERAIGTISLAKRFGELTAVDAVSLAIARGTIFGLIGPNGAGSQSL